MVRVIEARLRLPTFSIKHPEAFQVRASLPIPQPSTLIGLFTYCISIARDIGIAAGEMVGEWVDEGKLMAARASPLKTSLPMTISTIVLRRFRFADKAYFYKPSGEDKYYAEVINEAITAREFYRVKSLLERDLTDAFYREYVMSHELRCVWAISDDLELRPEWLMLAHRLGDTESLCSVLDVGEVAAEIVEEDVVETSFPAHLEGCRLVEGSYMIVKMCDEAFFHHREGGPRRFIVPCRVRVERFRGGAVSVITPSKVRVEYEEPVKVIRMEGGEEITAYTPGETRRRRR